MRAKPIDAFRRNLQKVYVERILFLLDQKAVVGGPSVRSWGVVTFPGVNPAKSDISSILRAELRTLQTKLKAAIPVTTDKLTKYHLQDVLFRIEKALSKD
ncbi:MAG: hypothetical protein NVV59_14625 [Chitinophagaceae bacterium]|nr:hypothetical protein [Chitinophagaceae bacterium]